MTSEDASSAILHLVALYGSSAARRLYDEAVTELEHALQCAALARAAGASAELVVAALLHDVGHLVVGHERVGDGDDQVDARHEAAGARCLSRWFGPAVTTPVGLHVAAKRYLCAVDDDHRSTLSLASVRSLQLQGGPMTADQRAAFEAHPHHEAAIALRRWDDRAKVAGRSVASFDDHLDLIRDVAHRTGSGAEGGSR